MIALLVVTVLGTSADASHARKGASPKVRSARLELSRPYAPSQQTMLAFGDRSHWLQPWRGYLETVPATKLRDAIGINIDNQVRPEEMPALARLLRSSGFRRARYEIGWSELDYDDPSRLRKPEEVRAALGALRDNGLRPLILLNANHGMPGPTRFFDARLAAPAPAGARRIELDPASAAAVVPGRSGLNSLTDNFKAAEVIFTSVEGNSVTLSKPLPGPLDAGAQPAAVLRYEPFGPPRLADGSANPGFERSLAGWLSYVDVVTREARTVFGSGGFDVEIWNEPSFGSDFLERGRYYEPDDVTGRGDTTQVLVARTVAWLRDGANGLGKIGISNGFESQRPWASGSTSPPGLSAISKHPYQGMRRFPQAAAGDNPGIRPLNALGNPDGRLANGRWEGAFTPTYDAFFPEYYMTGIQTENLIRDVSPLTTKVYGTPHGRRTRPPGGAPPEVWVTEWNMDPSGADPSIPRSAATPVAGLTQADVRHMQAKAALRFLTAWVNKGVGAAYLFAAKQDQFALVEPSFFDAIRERGGGYPGAEAGGEVMAAIGRLSAALEGAAPVSKSRSLSLLEVKDFGRRKQFDGDGTRARPPLYDKDVVGFFPYQLDSRRFVIPMYVMTRNVAKLYSPDAPRSDPRRFDQPEARFRLTIGGLRADRPVKVKATDLLSGRAVDAVVKARGGGRAVVELPLSDAPRVLSIEEG